MGITGLLPALKSIMHKAHLAEYNGLRAGIDAYSWLHRGAHCCLMELALGQDTDKYVLSKLCIWYEHLARWAYMACSVHLSRLCMHAGM